MGAVSDPVAFSSISRIAGVTFQNSKPFLENTGQITAKALNVLLALSKARENLETHHAIIRQKVGIIPVVNLQEVWFGHRLVLEEASKAQTIELAPFLTKLQKRAELPNNNVTNHSNDSEFEMIKCLDDRISERYANVEKSRFRSQVTLPVVLDAAQAIPLEFVSAVKGVGSWLCRAISSVVLGDEEQEAPRLFNQERQEILEIAEIGEVSDFGSELANLLKSRKEELKEMMPKFFMMLGNLNKAYEMLCIRPHLTKAGAHKLSLETVEGGSLEVNLEGFFDIARETHKVAVTFFEVEAPKFIANLSNTVQLFDFAKNAPINETTDQLVKDWQKVATEDRCNYLYTSLKAVQAFQERFENRKARIAPYIVPVAS